MKAMLAKQNTQKKRTSRIEQDVKRIDQRGEKNEADIAAMQQQARSLQQKGPPSDAGSGSTDAWSNYAGPAGYSATATAPRYGNRTPVREWNRARGDFTDPTHRLGARMSRQPQDSFIGYALLGSCSA
eukprot:6313498-Pyramimonas_sp.AAC.1